MFKTKKSQLIKYIFLPLAALHFIAPAAVAQNNLNSIPALFNQYQQNNLQEKIFAHTDKGFYVAGEIIWFKLYAVDATFNKPLDLSKVAYVEILDAGNKAVLQAKIGLKDGEGNGSLYIPLTINSGNYKLRAYTNWMKNTGPDYFFEKNITIVNTQKVSNTFTEAVTLKNDIQFFPEGGNLVAGLQSKVAFKAVTQSGKGIDFKGAIVNNIDTLLKFSPTHTGMGNFYFTPLPNHTYKAIIQFTNGASVTKELPQVYATGYVMSVKDSGYNKVSVTIESNISNKDNMYLFVHTGGSVKVAVTGSLQNGKTEFIFDKAKLGSGVSHITIFNSNKQPVCERLYFKKPDQNLQLQLSTNKGDYGVRSKVDINIETSNQGTKNDSSSLSMTVYRLDSLQSADEMTIDAYLLLGSELKGFIEDPQYYFSNNEPQTAAALDNLMLINGWRRFKWDDILQNTKPAFSFVPEYNGHIITGKVINTQTGSTQKDIETFLSVPGVRTQFAPSTSNEQGNIKFEFKNFYGSSEIIVLPDQRFDSIYRIEIDNPFSKNFSSTPVPAFHLSEQSSNTLLEQSVSMQVQNIYAGNKLKQFYFPAIDTTAFYLNPDTRYLLDDYTRFTTVEEVLREYVTIVNVTKRNGIYHFPTLDLSTNTMFTSDPLVLLDGMPVFNFNKFLHLDPLKLRKLDVLNRRYILGGSSFSGILNWQSYNGDMANYEMDPRAIVLDYEGLQLEREFYAPVYERQEQQLSHIPDFRNVLLWSPNIKLAANGKQGISFYTSDLTGRYAAVIQGISKNGLCGSSMVFFEVKK